MNVLGIRLNRPNIEWPESGSVWCYPVAQTVIATLTNGQFVSHMGWYIDDGRSGPVWHRWPKHWLSEYGVSVISAIYGLWCRGSLDVLVEAGQGKRETCLISSGKGDNAEAPLEHAIAAQLAGASASPVRVVVEGLPWPTPRRTIAERLLGTDQMRAATEAASFPSAIRRRLPSPDALTLGLDIVTAFVKLESCADIYMISPPDEAEAERREQAQLEIESAVLSAVTCRI